MRWFLCVENGRNVIRGWPGNKRLPIAKYRAIRDDVDQLNSLIKRLNVPADLKEKIELRHAFINDSLLEEYYVFLKTKIPAEAGAKTELTYLKRYALVYFINELGLINPADWYAVNETKWAGFLLSKKAPGSSKTKRDIVNSLNRFVKWLHRRRPDEVPLVTFDPISRAKYREIEARREMNGEALERKLISDVDLSRILSGADERIAPYLNLISAYGLRRCEGLGLLPGDVKKGFLQIQRQLKKLGVYAPPKGQEARETPHWYATPAQAYLWIEALKPMHPRTFSAKWDELMEKLELDYCIHDLRHTFITRAVRKYAPRDVQLAVGHKDLRITMGYLHDDRGLEAEDWTPTG